MEVRKAEILKQGGDVVGNRAKVKVVKNKIAPPFKEAEFDIMFGQGISREGDILDLAVKENIVEKSGAWYAYQGSKIGQGRENAKIYLRDNPAACQEIENRVRGIYGLGASSPAEETPAGGTEKEKTEKAGKSGRGAKADRAGEGARSAKAPAETGELI